MRGRRLVQSLVVVLALGQAGYAQTRQLTIDDIFDPVRGVDFSGSVPDVTWLPDGTHYLLADRVTAAGGRGLTRVDAASGRSEPFLDAARMEKALAAIPGFDAAEARDVSRQRGFTFDKTFGTILLSAKGDLYAYDVAGGKATRLTTAAGEETNESFSPDGRSVAFVRDYDLYVVDVATGTERRLTTGGTSDVRNGRLDWVLEEEVYGRGNTGGYWWSPDSKSIAYLNVDDTDVPVFTVVDEIPEHQTVERTHYPRVGDPNPKTKLGVVDASGGATRWVDTSAYDPSDMLVVRVGWTPDSSAVTYEVENRVQNRLDLNVAAKGGGAPRRILHEETPNWIEVLGTPEWLPDGTFLWQSERSGHRHIYHYAADGTLRKQVTTGDWDVRDFYGASPDGWVYFTASEHSPVSDNVYRVKLDGSGLKQLTQGEGNHSASFNNQFTSYFDTSSSAAHPSQLRLYGADGTLVRAVAENDVPALAQYQLSKPEFVHVKARDGFVLEAVMIKPPNFDPSKKYPVFSHTYSGPQASQVRDSWGRTNYLWYQLLAQKGYIVWVCDNRSASNKGIASAYTSYHNFGEQELRDLEDGVNWLKQQPYVDGSRIGLEGWSFGGFMTAYALTHSDLFKIGIAGGTVSDWRNYDSIYTERYMGLPKDNAQGYAKSSVVAAAPNLHGKLLLIHGAIDDNVHVQNTIQLVDALQKSGQLFELMLYPQSRHGVTNPLRVKHLYQMRTDFILKNL